MVRESVIRRLARAPRQSSPDRTGGSPYHHVTTGVSGASNGSTTDSA